MGLGLVGCSEHYSDLHGASVLDLSSADLSQPRLIHIGEQMYSSKMIYLIEAMQDERITIDQYHEGMRRIQHDMDREDSRLGVDGSGGSVVSSNVLCCEGNVNQPEVTND